MARSVNLPVRFQHTESVNKAITIKAPTITPEVLPPLPVHTRRLARMSAISEPYNLSANLDVSRIQAALRAAERGETWQLFTIYRDMILGYSHLQAEWFKRKAVIIGQPHSLIPRHKGNQDDEIAAKVIEQMIDSCDNWQDGLTHLLDATLYPVSVMEKIYEPVALSAESNFKFPIRYRLQSLHPVNYQLLCFRIPYLPQGQGVNENMRFNPDEWEPHLRLFNTLPNGIIDWTTADVYKPTPEIHVVHRSGLFGRTMLDNFGGQMRSILFWWLMSTQDRDWFSMYMQKYGSPFIVGKADASDKNAVDFMQNAFAFAIQIGGLVIDKRSEAELIQASAGDGANAHKTFTDVCNREVSKIILGQELSSTAKNTGLGSGMADFHGEVREDFRKFDTMKLADTLARQVFEPYLRMNGYRGAPPKIVWGGARPAEAKAIADTASAFALAGLQPTDEGLEVLSEKAGYTLERKPEPANPGALGRDTGRGNVKGKNGKEAAKDE